MSEPTVLLVDDEKDLVDMYALQLDDHYDTKVAYGGEEALERLDSSVDVIFLDRRMPDYSGDQVLSDVRREGWECSVIFVSAINKGDTDAEAAADGYLEKPAYKDDMIQLVEKHSQ
jgi:CheY-like chemotaxis protein